MEDRLHEIEGEIARAEAAIALCETQLQNFVSPEETQRQTQELANHQPTAQTCHSERSDTAFSYSFARANEPRYAVEESLFN